MESPFAENNVSDAEEQLDPAEAFDTTPQGEQYLANESDELNAVDAIARAIQQDEQLATEHDDVTVAPTPTKRKASGWAAYAAAKPREDNPTGPRFDEDGNRVSYPHHLT